MEELKIIDEFRICYISRESAVIGHFKHASKNGDENAIHELRVEIKKIRAFLELIKGITPYFDFRKTFQPIKELFKAAAPIRDAQVLQTMTREYISEVGLNVNLSEYFNILKNKEMVGKKDFLKFCKTFDPSIFEKNWSIVEKAISRYGENILSYDENLRDHAKDYIKTLLSNLNELSCKTALDESQYHDIRILCKRCRYTLEILSRLFAPEAFETMNKNLKQIHQPLGEWHDTEAAIKLINKILSNDVWEDLFLSDNSLLNQRLTPLFSKSSYEDMLQSFNVRKQHFEDLFLKRFKTFNLKEIF